MTEPLLTPYEVERKLLSLADALDQATEDLIEAESAFTFSKRTYEMALARARVQISKDYADASPKFTVQEKTDLALLACEDERADADADEIWVKGSKAVVANLKAQVDIIRSVGTSVRSSMDIA